MLGVTRVYSRKSTIVLSDVNRVFSALHKLEGDALALISPMGPKRKRISFDKLGDITPHENIESNAHLDQINLPTRKRSRRRSNDTAFTSITYTTGDGLDLHDISQDQFGRSRSVFQKSDRRLSVDSHLELEFPTLYIGGLEDRADYADPENILSQSTPQFLAREQDITLPPGNDLLFGSDLHAIELDPFQREISLSLDADHRSTPEHPALPGFDAGSDEFRQAFGQNLSSTPRNSAGNGSAVVSMLNPIDSVSDPVPEPLPEMVPDPTSIVNTADPSTVILWVREFLLTMAGRATGVRKRRSSAETMRSSKRSKGILSDRLIVTDVTELPIAHVRDCL
eukprot:IDg13491t1